MCEPIEIETHLKFSVTCRECSLDIDCDTKTEAIEVAKSHIDPPTHDSYRYHHHHCVIAKVYVVAEV